MKHSTLLDTYEQLPFSIATGEGVHVTSTSGDTYLDMYGGHAVSLLGHSPKKLIEAMHIQAEKLFFYSNISPLEIREQAGEKICSLLLKDYHHVFFCNSGAEANENALKLSLTLTKRKKLAAFSGSFHGRSFLATITSDTPKVHEQMNSWCDQKVTFLKPNVFEDLEKITSDHAAIILEPIQSIGGVICFSIPYLEALSKRCKETETLLIFDEVQTGMGRTGDPFFSGYCGVFPDMCTTAKGIASGYPVGALFVSDAIASQIKMGDLGATYGAGPIAMALVIATVDEIIKNNLTMHAKKLDALFRHYFSFDGIEEIRGKGCLIGLKTRISAKEVMTHLLKKRIITGTCKDPNVLRLLPPLIIQEEHIERTASTIKEIF